MLADEIAKIEFNNAQLLEPVRILAEGTIVEGRTVKGQTLTNSKLAELYIEGEICFEDCEFIGRLEISKTMASGTTFKNCIFHKNLIIKELESNITIISCLFHQDVLFYWDPVVDAFLIDIVDSRFNSNLTINGCNNTKILINTVKATEINIGEQSDGTHIKLLNSELQSFRINNSVIEELNVKNTKISNELTSNTSSFIFLKQSEIGQIRSDDPDFWIFLQKGRLIGPLFKAKKEQEEKNEYWSRVSETLLVFVNSFQKEHSYKEADIAFYLMRFARMKEKLHSKKIRDKMSGGVGRVFLWNNWWLGG